MDWRRLTNFVNARNVSALPKEHDLGTSLAEELCACLKNKVVVLNSVYIAANSAFGLFIWSEN